MSFKISLKSTSFRISLNSLGFYLSPECLFNFLWLVYSTMCGKNFSMEKFSHGKNFSNFSIFMVLTFIENALNLCMFTHAPVPHSKLQVEIFKNLFPPRQRGWRKLWFALSKFNKKIWRWLGTLFLPNVLALQFCE